MHTFYISTPFTRLCIRCSDRALLAIDYVYEDAPDAVDTQLPDSALARRIESQIRRYCRHADAVFELPLEPRGTEFQQRVWQAMQAIPPGRVRSYGDIARQLGSSPRAVGNACRANPIPLVIPCHRVVSAAGIGGFGGATGGQQLLLKRRLLAHEGVEI